MKKDIFRNLPEYEKNTIVIRTADDLSQYFQQILHTKRHVLSSSEYRCENICQNGIFNKNDFRLCSYSKFYGNQDNRKIPSATSSQHYFLLFPILGYKRGEQNSPFSRQGNCLKFISGPPVLLHGCRSREGRAWPPRF